MQQITIQPNNDQNLISLIRLAIENQLNILKHGIRKTRRKLQELEEEFKMDTEGFYRKYSRGELGDDMKFIRWAGEYETLKQLEQDYQTLQEAKLC